LLQLKFFELDKRPRTRPSLLFYVQNCGDFFEFRRVSYVLVFRMIWCSNIEVYQCGYGYGLNLKQERLKSYYLGVNTFTLDRFLSERLSEVGGSWGVRGRFRLRVLELMSTSRK
jgi:hypothetical protein